MPPKKSPKRPPKRPRSHMSDPTSSEAETAPKAPSKKGSKKRSKRSRGFMSERAAERWIAASRESCKRPEVMQAIADVERKRKAEAALLDEEAQALKRDACSTIRVEKEKDVAKQRFMAFIKRWKVEEEERRKERRGEGLKERQRGAHEKKQEERLEEGAEKRLEERSEERQRKRQEEKQKEKETEGQKERKAEKEEKGKKAQHQTILEELNKREEWLGWLSRNRSHSIDGGDSMECHAALEPKKKRK